MKKILFLSLMLSAAVAASMHLNAEDARAMRCAFEDMVEEFGHQALIVSMNPFGPMIA